MFHAGVPTPYHLVDMRIEVHDLSQARRGRTTLDPSQRPPRAQLDGVEDSQHPQAGEVFLDWDGALDDSGHLRRCPICGGDHLFKVRTLPTVTPIFVILAFAGTAVSLFGFANNPIILAALVLVVLVELVILVIARTRLVCYRCRSRFAQTPIAPYHAVFDPQIAQLDSNQPTQDMQETMEDDPGEGSPVQPLAAESRRARLARMRILTVEEANRELQSDNDPDPS